MEQIKLDIVPAGITPTAHASQFDSGRSQRFNLYNQGAEYTLSGAETITMVVNGVEEPVANTSDNYVVWNIADGDCDEAGVIGCELRIVENDMLIGSKNFFLEVEMDPYDGTNIHIVELSGSLLTFETTLPEPFVSCKASIVASQASGTPTPSSPLAISGYTGVTISVADENMSVQDTYTISWQDEAGTVYGGNLDLTTGLLTVTWGSVDMGTLTWSNNATYWYNSTLVDVMYDNTLGYNEISHLVAEKFIATKPSRVVNGSEVGVANFTAALGGLMVYTGDLITPPSGLLIYELATPQTYQLTPTQVRALVGVNNVWADTGDITIKYLAEA